MLYLTCQKVLWDVESDGTTESFWWSCEVRFWIYINFSILSSARSRTPSSNLWFYPSLLQMETTLTIKEERFVPSRYSCFVDFNLSLNKLQSLV